MEIYLGLFFSIESIRSVLFEIRRRLNLAWIHPREQATGMLSVQKLGTYTGLKSVFWLPLGNLRCFSRASFTNKYYALVGGQKLHKILSVFKHRESNSFPEQLMVSRRVRKSSIRVHGIPSIGDWNSDCWS